MIRTVRVGRTPGYDVLIGSRLMDRAGEKLAPYAPSGRVVVFTDATVAEHHGERLTAAIEAAPLAAELVVDGRGLLRDVAADDLVLFFGGGRLRDRTPSVEAALKRGARFAMAPTTFAAQVECVCRPGEPEPSVVLADLDVLATLDPVQVKSGYALLMKHALAADGRLFSWLEAHGRCVIELQAPELSHAVGGCVDIRASTPADQLDVGDAFAAALSAEAGADLTHGDAVGLGCALAFQFAATLGVCAADQAERATWNLAAAGLSVRLEAAPGAPFCARALTARVRQAAGDEPVLTLPRRIGEAAPMSVDTAALQDFLIAQGAMP